MNSNNQSQNLATESLLPPRPAPERSLLLIQALQTISNWSKCQCVTTHGDNPNCAVLIAETALGAFPSICATDTLGPDDLILPCILPKGHGGLCSTGR